MTDRELVLKAGHILLAKLHLFEAGEQSLTVGEWNLICDLADWYEHEGKLIAEGRRLTQMQVVLD
jgi:hypothetical protein